MGRNNTPAAPRFSIDLHSGVPVYRQLIDQVRSGVAAGSLTAGDQLPTVRQLAVDLEINPNTVMRAYRELELGGLLETHQGTGTFISNKKLEKNSAERERQARPDGWRIRGPRRRRRIRPRGSDRSSARLVAQKEIVVMARIRMHEVSGIARLLFVISLVIGLAISRAVNHPAPAIIGALVGLYFLFAIKVVQQWEKVAVLRLGRYVGLRGPGMCHIIPIFETLSPYVDQRVRVASVSAESTLTRDTVPVNVDAIVFWMVWNAEKSILEVENFIEAITMSAQTALRESIGRHELAQMITERETARPRTATHPRRKNQSLGHHRAVRRNSRRENSAGLEDAMSRQAQAERERQARIILGQAENEISEQLCASCRRVCRKPYRPAPARHEHALRSRQGKGCDGDRPLVRSRNHGPGRNPGHRFTRRRKTVAPAACPERSRRAPPAVARPSRPRGGQRQQQE